MSPLAASCSAAGSAAASIANASPLPGDRRSGGTSAGDERQSKTEPERLLPAAMETAWPTLVENGGGHWGALVSRPRPERKWDLGAWAGLGKQAGEAAVALPAVWSRVTITLFTTRGS